MTTPTPAELSKLPRHEDPELVERVAGVIARVEANWDREGSGPGSRFDGERREWTQARGVVADLRAAGLLP